MLKRGINVLAVTVLMRFSWLPSSPLLLLPRLLTNTETVTPNGTGMCIRTRGVRYTDGQRDRKKTVHRDRKTVRSTLFVKGLGATMPKPSRTLTFLRFPRMSPLGNSEHRRYYLGQARRVPDEGIRSGAR